MLVHRDNFLIFVKQYLFHLVVYFQIQNIFVTVLVHFVNVIIQSIEQTSIVPGRGIRK